MKIFSAFKFVEEEQDIVVNADRTLDLSKATVKISPFDLNAIEAAVQAKSLVEGAEITAISVGGKRLANPKARKDVLSRGPDNLLLVQDDLFEDLRPNETAKVLSGVLSIRGFDLLICGNGSADIYAQQTGLLLGEALSIPTVNAVSRIVSLEEKKIVVERSLEDEVETLEIQLPAVICVTADINEPQIPAMRAILAAAKKPVEVMSASDFACTLENRPVAVESILAQPQKDRAQVVIEGEDDASIEAFAAHLRKALV